MRIEKIIVPVISAVGTIEVIGTAIMLKGMGSKDVLLSDSMSHANLEAFGEVPLSELNKIAREVYHGINCTVNNGYLWFHYKSNRGHQLNHAQMAITKLGKLMVYGDHYAGETRDSADEFAKRANELFTFIKK